MGLDLFHGFVYYTKESIRNHIQENEQDIVGHVPYSVYVDLKYNMGAVILQISGFNVHY